MAAPVHLDVAHENISEYARIENREWSGVVNIVLPASLTPWKFASFLFSQFIQLHFFQSSSNSDLKHEDELHLCSDNLDFP